MTGSPEAPAKAGISVADIAGGMYALQRHPGRPAAARADRPRRHRPGVAVRRAGRVDVAALAAGRADRPRAGPHRRPARHHRPVRRVPDRRRRRGAAGRAERGRVDAAVPRRPRRARPGRRRPVRRATSAGWTTATRWRISWPRRWRGWPRANCCGGSTGPGSPTGRCGAWTRWWPIPQLAARWTAIAAGDRQIRVLPPPVRHGGFGPVLGPVPGPGRDTEAVLAEFLPGEPAPPACG